MKTIDIPKFESKEDLFKYLVENKEDLIYQKKSITKFEDTSTPNLVIMEAPSVKLTDEQKFFGQTNKNSEAGATELKIRAVINTTNIKDSHGDVHIKGLWNRSLSNNKNIKMLQEHEMKLDKVIADKNDLEAYVKDYAWKELGFDVEGKTEALIFDATVKESRNTFMFNEYKDGNVDNHSVGMRYVKIKLAVNSTDESYKVEKETYDKYIDTIANKDEVEKDGFFWAILEAKAIEGSAVVIGSNPMTPTLARNKHQEEGNPQPDDRSLEEKEISNFLKL